MSITPMSTAPIHHETTELHLEPRVARLETNMETLTRTVSELATSIRENTDSTNTKIDNLIVSVTQAQAPKRPDYSLMVSIGFFILALGSAVFWPLNKGVQDNKEEILRLHGSVVEHQKLDLHPVGQAKVENLIKDVDMTRLDLVKRDFELDTKIQRETQLMTDLVTAKLAGMDQRLQVEMGLRNDVILAKMKVHEEQMKAHERQDELEGELAISRLNTVKEKNDLFIDKLFGRVQELERERIKIADREHEELMLWRQKAMGLSSPNAVVPLVPRDSYAEPTSATQKK